MLSRLLTSFSRVPIWFRLGWILVGLGAIFLRFYAINERAWGYDELSAIFRAMHSDSWYGHLKSGVAVDGHPAGLQTFLWLWVDVFGTEVLPLRIITALVSVFTMVQIHGIAKRHFGFETAFWTIAMMGLMWWQVNMGIWIRPYIFGLPFVLWAWDLVLGVLRQRNAQGDVVLPERMGWFAVKLGGALAGASYIHYFAGLTAGASFIALLLIQPKITPNNSNHTQGIHPSYIIFLPITVAFILYLPHLTITFAQFQLGGLGWLNQPSPDFLWQFLYFASGNSLPILILFTASCIYSLQLKFRVAYLPKPASLKRILRQPSILLTLGFFIIFTFGYIFSVVRAPILQNNALYFAFPLLILVAADGLTAARNHLWPTQRGTNRFERTTQALAIIFPMALLFNTLYQKQFLTLERKGSHHRIVEQSIQIANGIWQGHMKHPASKAKINHHIWLDGPADNYQFHRGQILHIHKTPSVPPADYFETQGPSLFYIAQKLHSLKPLDQVFLGVQSGSQPWLLPLIESHFNCTSRYDNDSISEEKEIDRQLSSDKRPTQEQLIGGEWLTLSNPRVPQFTATDFHLQQVKIIQNTADTISLSARIVLSNLNPKPNDVILIVVKSNECSGEIQTSLWNPNPPQKHFYNQEIYGTYNQIDWRSTRIEDYTEAGFNYAIHAIKLADIPNWTLQSELRVNIGNADICLIGKYLGNPYLYGIN